MMKISHQVADFALSPDGTRLALALALVTAKDEVSLILSNYRYDAIDESIVGDAKPNISQFWNEISSRVDQLF
ncbi:hypothetical protein [uncultured Brevibacillus sp.]|uniref:hypothetical protein n=1 Tax=uncultured Brevibacillus sp. TaxID=169970 RepID=UPI002597C0D2|nr:hypothetical protein [uncultured Brevibacillus sp.]